MTSLGPVVDYVTSEQLEAGARQLRDFTLKNGMWRHPSMDDLVTRAPLKIIRTV